MTAKSQPLMAAHTSSPDITKYPGVEIGDAYIKVVEIFVETDPTEEETYTVNAMQRG